jgi:malonyl-CoA/methylmalonyl-CoA synthetase
MLFLTRLYHNCQRLGSKLALEFAGQQLSYIDLEKYTQQAMAYLISLGVVLGDRVAIQLPKSLEFILLHLAAMRLGAISLPLNPAFPAAELEYFLADSEAKVYFGDARARAKLTSLQGQGIWLSLGEGSFFDRLSRFTQGERLPPLPSDPAATALMIYTSGTTGRPKGAELGHGNLTANLEALQQAWAWQEEDVLLHVLPIFHTHGLMVALHGALQAGASTVLLDKFHAQQTLELLLSRRFSVFMAVPTIYSRLLAEAGTKMADLSFMRLMTSGSARLPEDVFLAVEKTFGYRLLERYGMTETGMNLSNPYLGERRMGSVGVPLPGVEVRVVNPATEEVLADGDIGELQIRGPHVFKGYWRQAEKTAEAFSQGWLRTADLGLREKDGYYSLKGRAKELIITGGFNVYPPEVELVLAEHPELAQSAVIGCPDKDWGESVTAVVVRRAHSSVSEQEIIQFCRERLAAYKTPKRVVFVEALAQNAMGKVQKQSLQEQICRAP